MGLEVALECPFVMGVVMVGVCVLLCAVVMTTEKVKVFEHVVKAEGLAAPASSRGLARGGGVAKLVILPPPLVVR